jgi:uncharacterized protein DUF6984
MSGELSSNPNQFRALRPEELDLLTAILKNHHLVGSLSTLNTVRDLSDGGMGSIEFLGAAPNMRRHAQCVAEADYMDSDGIPVSIAVNVDQDGRLFELDIWKVDFGKLRSYPSPKTIRNIRHLPAER